MAESQEIEYKESWRDEYFKTVCGFANAQGGRLFIGIADTGNVTGVPAFQKLMETIPNKSINLMGIVVDVNLHQKENKFYLEICVSASLIPVSYHGIYYYRSGSTTQELKGIALQELLLRKYGKYWDDMIVAEASKKDINTKAVKQFVAQSIEMERLPKSAARDSVETLLKKLKLTNDKGQLKNGALLLFGQDPLKYFTTASFKIGRFVTNDDLRFHDVVEGNIFEMPDKVIGLLKYKYLISPISYKGLRRYETLEYPEPALREAILNAIVHKDYRGSYIQLSVYDDKLILWNPGKLPPDISIQTLKTKHPSIPRNQHIAEVFFKAGHIEAWGRGIEKILKACKNAGLPEPVFKEEFGGVQVTFFKSLEPGLMAAEPSVEYVTATPVPLNNRQRKAIAYVREFGTISNREYQQLNKVARNTASRDLQDLIVKNIFIQTGTRGAGSKYMLVTEI